MNKVFEFEDGQVRVWIEQEAIHMFACDISLGFQDPVELTGSSARALAAKLIELAEAIHE